MVQILFAFILIPPCLAKYKKKSTIKIEPKIKMNYEIYNVHCYNYPYLVHKKINHWSIWGKEDSKIKLCFSGKARNWIKYPTKNIRRQLHSIPYFCTQKDSCYTKVLQKFMAKPHNFLLRLKSPHKVIKHITTKNIHKILWKVYCFELSSYCTPLPPPPPPKCAPDFEGQMANFPREFLEHHSMLTDVLQKELCKHFRAEFCTLTWNSLLLKMNLDSFFCYWKGKLCFSEVLMCRDQGPSTFWLGWATLS